MDINASRSTAIGMSVVTLVSGGLDSTVMAVLAREEGVAQSPLFIDYGQRSRHREWVACTNTFRKLGLPRPRKMNIAGFGKTVRSGLTSKKLDVFKDAFLPARNLLFLVCGAAFAKDVGAKAVLIGLLDESTHLFPDQTDKFLAHASQAIHQALGEQIEVVAPLRPFVKRDIVRLAGKHGVTGTYSCHRGTLRPCGTCIACREFIGI